MDIQTRYVNVTRNKNWVLYGSEGTLETMGRRLDIQHYLRKAARRMRRQVSSQQQIYSEY